MAVREIEIDGSGLSKDDLLLFYRNMVLSRSLDDEELSLKRKNLIFFQISGAGHEAVLTAIGHEMDPSRDWFYPYYRDRALCLMLGMTPTEMLMSAVGALDDPNSHARQMPSHWGHRDLNIVTQSSPTGTQVLQAVGCAAAGRLYDRIEGIPDRASRFSPDEAVYVSLGDGTTSQGEFWEGLNTACNLRLPVLFHIEDNGYAISTPVDHQTPGGDISALVRGYPNLKVIDCDGTDPVESLVAAREALSHCRAGSTARAHGPTRTPSPTTTAPTGRPTSSRLRRPVTASRRSGTRWSWRGSQPRKTSS